MSRLRGAHVALLEARMSGELADLIRRYGGVPYCVPAVREALLESEAQVAWFIDRLAAGALPVVVFLTGAGASALFREAERQERLPETQAALKRVTTVCRGPKPAAVLKRHGVPIHSSAAEPYTTSELLEAMRNVELTEQGVALVHYGERNTALAEALKAQGARLDELCLYEWLMPEDIEPLKQVVRELVAGQFNAVAFTSQIQCRHLFQVATDLGQAAHLMEALNTNTIVAAVGPVCAASLESFGVTPHVVPEIPKMGPMVAALAEYLESSAARRAR